MEGQVSQKKQEYRSHATEIDVPIIKYLSKTSN